MKYYSRIRKDEKAAIAVEFALVIPLFLLLLFGIICFGTILGIYHEIQQLVSEAARASLAGLSDSERDSLAKNFISVNVGSYPLIDPKNVTVSTSAYSSNTSTFKVSIQYDMSNSYINQFYKIVPLPPPIISRTAVIQRSGY